jgi:threonine synthase
MKQFQEVTGVGSPYSYLSYLECGKCGQVYDADVPQQLCSCGSPLLARYDLASLGKSLTPHDVERREPNLWRYHELLPVRNPGAVMTLGEGMTPLLPLSRLGERLGLPNLFLKDEGLLPTGTFKARGAAVGISRAHELGVTTVAMPTNGNAGAAWAAYAAKAGIDLWTVIPTSAPDINTMQCQVTGAHVFQVDGLISDAGRIVGRAVKEHAWFDGSTLKEPYRIEGKKTMGVEIVEQLGWTMPDVIIYPTGGGVGLIGIYKALLELRELGWVSGPLPRLVAVQASGCAPIVKAWEAKAAASEFWEGAYTIAFGITVPKALGDFLVLQALYATEGCALAVEDADMVRDQRLTAGLEGAFICLEGAATVTALRHLLDSGWIQPTERVVLLNTGTGLIGPDLMDPIEILDPTDDLPVTAQG